MTEAAIGAARNLSRQADPGERTAPEIEARIVAFSLEQPAFRRIRVAQQNEKARLFDHASRGARRLAAP